MTADDRITMKNPNTGRDDRTISVAMFEPVRDAIVRAIGDAGELPWGELTDAVVALSPAALWESSSPDWYTVTVKLHLEATGVLQRHGSPHVLTLTAEGERVFAGL